MNRFFIALTVALLFVSGAAYAQDMTNTIKGKVVDRKGNPVVGTKITLKNGGIVTTDFDGAFEIAASPKEKAVANCVGMQEKKVKMKDGMVIKLTKTTGWNRKPTKFSPFVMLQGGISFTGNNTPVIGIKGGMVKRVGWYASVVSTTDIFSGKKADVEFDRNERYSSRYWETNSYSTMRVFSLGAVFRLGCPLHLCLGICGYKMSGYYNLYPDINGNIHSVLSYSYFDPAVDLGLMLSFKHFTMDVSLHAASATLGIGYKF